MLSKQWFVKMKPLAESPIEIKRRRTKSNSSRTASRMSYPLDERSRGLVHFPPALVGAPDSGLLQQKDRRVLVSETEPDLNLYTAGRRRFGYLVLERPLALCDHGLARYHFARLSALFPDQFPQYRLRHHLLLGLAHDVPVASLHGQVPFKQVVIHGLSAIAKAARCRNPWEWHRSARRDRQVWRRCDALFHHDQFDAGHGYDLQRRKARSAEAYLNKIWNACRYVEGVLGETSKPSSARSRKTSRSLMRPSLTASSIRSRKVTSKMEKLPVRPGLERPL
jgi:hypothetical protein